MKIKIMFLKTAPFFSSDACSTFEPYLQFATEKMPQIELQTLDKQTTFSTQIKRSF